MNFPAPYRTSERKPTEQDALGYSILAFCGPRIVEPSQWLAVKWEAVAKHPEHYRYWMPFPPAPKSPCEQAFEQWQDAHFKDADVTFQQVWTAAWQSAQQEKA